MNLLRPIRADDFADAFDISADYQVVQGVGSWPWPAQPAYTRMRLNTDAVKAGQVLAIDVDGRYAGNIGLVDGEMGYMLARRYWGQGLASRAVAEMLALGFGQWGLQAVRAAAWSDNIASQRVLQKNGFEWVGRGEDYGRGRDRISPIERFLLTRARWAATAPLRIETARLEITPFGPGEAGRFSHLMNDIDVARMMASITHPFPPTAAEAWIDGRKWAGRLGFCAAVRLKNGPLIGTIGIGGSPLSFAYAYGRDFWGQGYATESARAFLAEMQTRFAPEEIEAGAYTDNPASQRVLEKLGFVKTGEIMDKSPARLEPAPLVEYRWRPMHIGARDEIS